MHHVNLNLSSPGLHRAIAHGKAFARDQRGQDLIEYALLAATLALGTILGMQGLVAAFDSEVTNITNAFGS